MVVKTARVNPQIAWIWQLLVHLLNWTSTPTILKQDHRRSLHTISNWKWKAPLAPTQSTAAITVAKTCSWTASHLIWWGIFQFSNWIMHPMLGSPPQPQTPLSGSPKPVNLSISILNSLQLPCLPFSHHWPLLFSLLLWCSSPLIPLQSPPSLISMGPDIGKRVPPLITVTAAAALSYKATIPSLRTTVTHGDWPTVVHQRKRLQIQSI